MGRKSRSLSGERESALQIPAHAAWSNAVRPYIPGGGHSPGSSIGGTTREEEPKRRRVRLRRMADVDSAPKGRNDEAQAEGLGLHETTFLALSPERAS